LCFLISHTVGHDGERERVGPVQIPRALRTPIKKALAVIVNRTGNGCCASSTYASRPCQIINSKNNTVIVWQILNIDGIFAWKRG
jgi:hypothetical protein